MHARTHTRTPAIKQTTCYLGHYALFPAKYTALRMKKNARSASAVNLKATMMHILNPRS